MKKALIISIVLLLFVLIFWGVYAFLVRDSRGEKVVLGEDATEETEETKTQPVALSRKVTNIMSFPVLDGTQGEGSDLLRAWTKNGRAFEMTDRGTNQKEIAQLFHPMCS